MTFQLVCWMMPLWTYFYFVLKVQTQLTHIHFCPFFFLLLRFLFFCFLFMSVCFFLVARCSYRRWTVIVASVFSFVFNTCHCVCCFFWRCRYFFFFFFVCVLVYSLIGFVVGCILSLISFIRYFHLSRELKNNGIHETLYSGLFKSFNNK